MKTRGAGVLPSVGIVLCLIWLSGCGTVPDEARTMAVGTLRLSAKTGPVGLTTIRSGPEFTVVMPATRREAARLTSAGAAKETARSELALLFPVAFVLGAVEGTLVGTSEPELKRMATTIETALREFQSATRVAESVTQQLAPLGPDRIRTMADNLPLDPIPAQGRKQPPVAHPLRDSPVEVLVGIRISFLGFQIYTPPELRSTGDYNQLQHEYNPLFALVWAVDVMAMRPRDWAAVGGLTARYESIPRRFREWADGDARLLRDELQTALQFVQRQIAHRITVEPAPRAALPHSER